MVLTYGIPPEFRGGVHVKPPYAIGSVPSLSGHAVAYRWRSLPRVQGSSERVLPWQITMDQLIFASLSHTYYWYEVGMLKVPYYVWLSPKKKSANIYEVCVDRVQESSIITVIKSVEREELRDYCATVIQTRRARLECAL